MNHVLTFVIQYVFVGGIERYEKFDVKFTSTQEDNEDNILLEHQTDYLTSKLNEFFDKRFLKEIYLPENFQLSLIKSGFLNHIQHDAVRGKMNDDDLGITEVKILEKNSLPGLLNLTNILYINIVPE